MANSLAQQQQPQADPCRDLTRSRAHTAMFYSRISINHAGHVSGGSPCVVMGVNADRVGVDTCYVQRTVVTAGNLCSVGMPKFQPMHITFVHSRIPFLPPLERLGIPP